MTLFSPQDDLGAASPPGETAQAFLRRATHTLHKQVEHALAPFDLTEVDGLRNFLSVQARAVIPIEEELDARGVAEFLPDWKGRRRSAALVADLRSLNASVPAPLSVTFERRAQQLGALYVLEGSRLGGKMLKRMAEASPDPRVRGTLQFLGHRVGPRSWPVFVDRLNALAADPAMFLELQRGAEASFSLFHAAACGFSPASGVPLT